MGIWKSSVVMENVAPHTWRNYFKNKFKINCEWEQLLLWKYLWDFLAARINMKLCILTHLFCIRPVCLMLLMGFLLYFNVHVGFESFVMWFGPDCFFLAYHYVTFNGFILNSAAANFVLRVPMYGLVKSTCGQISLFLEIPSFLKNI